MINASSINYCVFKSVALPIAWFVQNRFQRFIPTDLFTQLKSFNPNIIVCPEYSLQTLMAVVYKKLFGVKLIIWVSLTAEDERLSFRGQERFRCYLRTHADAFVCYSSRAIEYLAKKGISRDRCHLVENCTDVQYFLTKEPLSERPVPEQVVLLYVGALVVEKGLRDLFTILTLMRDQSWELIVAGSGALRTELEYFNAEHFDRRIKFLGDVRREELPPLYQKADIVIFPSHSDVWGHVIDEAMASGRCVLASDRSGAALELIEDGSNGFIFQAGHTGSLAEVLKKLITNHYLREQAGRNARQTMEFHNEFSSAKGMYQALRSVLEL